MTANPTTELPLNVLIVDDNEDDALLIARRFRTAGYSLASRRVDTAEEMAVAIRQRTWDLIIADVTMPLFSASAALELYSAAECDCPFIVVSGTIGEETAVTLLKAGAHDFVLKTNLVRLVPAAERELREAAGRRARTRAEEALRVSEERYALAARGANDGLWDWDLHRNRIYYSPRWLEMLGLTAEEAGDEPEAWFRRIHPEDVAAVRRQLDDHLDGSATHFAVEYRMRHHDGGWRWMLARGLAVIEATGFPCRIAGSQTDVSAHKEGEERLRRAKEELEQAVAAKTRFLAAASHDLRQPLQAMFCFTSLLEMQLEGRPEMATLSDLDSSMQGLKSLLDSLLDVSRLDAGVVTASVSQFSVDSLLSQVATEMKPLAGAKGLRMRVVGSRASVRSDPVLLLRILRNLVENAIRYTDHGGGIVVGCRRRGDRLAISVCDSGAGIPEASQTRIFEEFYQLANPERDRRKGLGLGLAIVNRLSRLLDHPIELRSVVNRGSVFTVSVPIIAAAREAAASTRESEVDPANGRILVIDDEMLVATALARLLEAWGFEPIVASSYEEAVALIDEPPRAVVADYRLREGRTGVEAVGALCRRYAASIPSIVVTGDTAVDRLREIAGSGSLLLHKPVSPRDLRQALHTVLAGQAADSATDGSRQPAASSR